MKQLSTKNNTTTILGLSIYYIILTFILLSWNSIDQTPPTGKRMIFLIAFIVPLFKFKDLFPALLVSFTFIQSNMITPMGYFPNKPIFILSICIIMLGIYKKKERRILLQHIKSSKFLIFFILYTLLINLFNLNTNINGVISLLFILVFSSYFINYSTVKNFLAIFPLACITSSLYFLSNMSTALIETSSGAERAFFNDPNMTALNIGFGIIISFVYIIQEFSLFNNKKLFIIHSVNIILSFVCIMTIASRGAFIALSLSLILLYLTSKINRSNKFFIFLVGILVLFIAYKLGIFNTIIARLTEDDVTSGNGRVDIWKVGFSRFLQLDILTILLGGGDFYALEVCKKAILGYSGLLSPHNQFLWYIFDYGFIGGLLFIIYLMSLLYNSIKANNRIYILLIYSMIGFMTLPPISSSIIYPTFLSFIIAIHNKKTTI